MSIITTFFNYLIFFFIGLVAISIFIETNKELWNEVGKDTTHDLIVKIKELTVKALDGTVSVLGKTRLALWKMRNKIASKI